jgi:hypothetical protein
MRFRDIYEVRLMRPDLKPQLEILLPLFEEPLFSKEWLKNTILKQAEENITFAKSAPWYLRTSRIVDVSIVEYLNKLSGYAQLTRYIETQDSTDY